VVANRRRARFGVHREFGFRVDAHFALGDHAAVHDEFQRRALGIRNFDDPAGHAKRAPVTDLSAALGVKGGFVDDDLHRFAARRELATLTIHQ